MKIKKKIKKNLPVTLLLIFIILISTSCIITDKNETKSAKETTEKESKKKDEQKTKVKKKDKENKNSVSELPYILLERTGEGHFDEDFNYLYIIHNVHLKLEQTTKEFEPLIKVFDKYNKEADEVYKYELMELASPPQYTEEEESEYGKTTPSVGTSTYIIRADKAVVSIVNYKNAYYGGGSIEYLRYSTNFDTASGKELAFSDVVKDENKFLELADERAKEYYDDLKPSERIKEDGKELTWTIGSEGVSLYFDIYEQQAYEELPRIVTVYFDEDKSIFNPKYTKAEGEYVTPLVKGMKLELDIDGDGKRESVYADKILSEGPEVYDSMYSGIKIVAGDKESKRIDGFDYEAYVLKKSGKYYIYVFMSELDDAKLLYIVDLSNIDQIEDENLYVSIGNRENDWKRSDGVEKFYSLNETFTNPDFFMGSFRYDVLGTNTCMTKWTIKDDAHPEAGQRCKLTDNSVLHTKADISCIEVDGKGNEKKESVIPSDSYILLLYTDKEYVDVRIIDEKYVDELKWGGVEERYFELNDKSLSDYEGSCYRFRLESDEYGRDKKVNGINIEELFEGLSYSS